MIAMQGTRALASIKRIDVACFWIFLLQIFLLASLCPAHAQENLVLFSGPFMRDEGQPQTHTVEFLSPAAVSGTLQILNGGENQTSVEKRVSSAIIALNGVKVISPDRFSQNTAVIEQAVQLRAGTNKLEVTLRSKPRSLVLATAQADFPVGGIELRADPPGFFVQTSATVRVEARVREASNPAPAAIELLPLSSSGGLEFAPACTMSDEGQAVSGDDAAGDGIYTCVLSLSSATNQDFSYMARAVVGGSETFSRPLVIKAVEPIQAADLQTMHAVQEAASDHWTKAAAKFSDTLNAKLDTAAFIRGLDGVANAGVSEDDQTIWIRFKSGLHFAFFDTPEDPLGTNAESNSVESASPQAPRGAAIDLSIEPFTTERPSARGLTGAFSLLPAQSNAYVVGNNDVLIWKPFFFDSGSTGSVFEHASCPKFSNKLSLLDARANVDSVRSYFPRYGTVFVNSHGGILSDEPVSSLNGKFGFLSGELLPDCWYQKPVQADCLPPERNFQLSTGELTAGRPLHAGERESVYVITPYFFENLPSGQFQNTVIYMGTCSSAKNNTLADVLIRKGAAAYFGFIDDRYSGQLVNIGNEIFTAFNGPTTAIQAYDSLSSSYHFLKLLPLNSAVRYSVDEQISFTANRPTGTASTSRPTITARIEANGPNCIRPFENVNLLVDGNWVRSGCEGCFETPPDEPVTSVQISYTPDVDYAPGPHTAKIVVTTESGLVRDFEWNFSIAANQVLAPSASQHYEYVIYTAPLNINSATITATVTWASDWYPPPSYETTTSAPNIVEIPYNGGYGCDHVWKHPENNAVYLALVTSDRNATATGSITVGPGKSVAVAGSDCNFGDNFRGNHLVTWSVAVQ